MWTATSWHALVDSYGVGVGVGSTRASSSVVGVTSSTGFLGALLFYGFVAQTMTRRAKPRDPEGALVLSAVRWSFLPPFAISLMIGISADFGPMLAFLFGLSAAVAFSSATERCDRPVPCLFARDIMTKPLNYLDKVFPR